MSTTTTTTKPSRCRDLAHIWSRPGLNGARLMHAHYQRHRFRPHSHEVFTVGAVQEGVFAINISGCERRIAAGALCLIAPGEIHTGECGSAELEYRNVYLPRASAEQLLGLYPGGPRSVSFANPQPEDRGLQAAFVSAHERLEGEPSAAAVDGMKDVLAEILRRFAGPIIVAGVEPDRRRVVEDALKYLHASYNQALPLAELAGHVALSRYHFLRVFRDAVGLTPHAYLIQYRIKRSKELLLAGKPIAEVALAVGFSDQSHFGGHFKSIVGLSPGRYVRSLRPS